MLNNSNLLWVNIAFVLFALTACGGGGGGASAGEGAHSSCLQDFNVSIEQSLGQADPTHEDLAVFDVIFEDEIKVSTLDIDDFNIGYSDARVTELTQISNKQWQVSVAGMTNGETIRLAMARGRVENIEGGHNNLSNSYGALIDDEVTYVIEEPVEPLALTATFSRSSDQSRYTNVNSAKFDLNFNQAINAASLSVSDISIVDSATATIVEPINQVDDSHWTITLNNLTDGDKVSLSMAAGSIETVTGLSLDADSSFSGSDVIYDITPPVLVSSDEDYASGSNPFKIRLEFSERMKFPNLSIFSVSNGSVDSSKRVSKSIFDMLVLPESEGVVSIEISPSVAEDMATNNPATNDTITREVRYFAPVKVTAAIGSSETDVILKNADDTVPSLDFFESSDGNCNWLDTDYSGCQDARLTNAYNGSTTSTALRLDKDAYFLVKKDGDSPSDRFSSKVVALSAEHTPPLL